MTASDEDELRKRVRVEIRLQYGSVRKASIAGDVSNTTVGQWLRGETTIAVSDSVRRFAVNAFGWANDWPENPPPSPIAKPKDPTNGDLLRILIAMAMKIDDSNALLRAIALDRKIALPPELEHPPASVVPAEPQRSHGGRHRGSRRDD